MRYGKIALTMSDPSVTRWLHDLHEGCDVAAQCLWEFLHKRLLGLAQKQLDRKTPVAFDEEDVALSAFDSLCRAIQQGQYEIGDRDELWSLLAVITVNKARRRVRDENRLRRGGGHTQHDSDVLETLMSAQPDVSTTIMMQEECERLLAMLKRREVQLVALLKVEGYTNEQIASLLGCSRRAVQRRLNIIRRLWRTSAQLEPTSEAD